MPTPSSNELKTIKVVFCSHDRVHAGWAYDMMHLVGSFISSGGMVPETQESFRLSLEWCMTSLLAEGRHKLAEVCKEKGADKILWVDTDMRIPRQALQMLLRHREPIVGVNYVSRRPPFRFTAATKENEPLVTRPDSTGLVEVNHIGMGCLLTDISVFQGDGPHFTFDWERKEDNSWGQVGEDVFFCREARSRGYKIYVDQELSAQVQHEGDFAFSPAEMLPAGEYAVDAA